MSSYRQKGIQVAMDMIYGASLRKLSLFPKETGEYTVEEYNHLVKVAVQNELSGRDNDECCWNIEEEQQNRMEKYLGMKMSRQHMEEFAAGFYSVVDSVLREGN